MRAEHGWRTARAAIGSRWEVLRASERGATLPELLVGFLIGALVLGSISSAIFTLTGLHQRANDRNAIAAGLSIASLGLDRDGAMAAASAPAKSQTTATACTNVMDLGFQEAGASVRYWAVADAAEGPLWFQRLSGAGARTLVRRVSSCSWRAEQDPSGDWTLAVTLAITGPSGETATQTLRAAPRLFHPGSGAVTYFLHNNPTPPVGNTNQQANLPLDMTAPAASALYNYDRDRDSSPGRLLAKGGSGAGETDLTKYQNWRTGTLGSNKLVNGTVTFQFWSAIKDFGTGKQGQVTAYLRDFNPATSTYTTIAQATLTQANWQGGSGTWVSKTLALGVTNYTILSGRRLELKIIIGSSAGDDMWFAYDDTAHASRLVLP